MDNLFKSFDMDKVTLLVNQVKNVVMQYTEYEGKVRDITNNDPWGMSSTAMMDIAQATYNYQHFNDIISSTFKRLQEPSGSNWRHNYKALQLIEFLIANGSEQVIDACRNRLYEIKGMQNYRHIDEAGKDQGSNSRYVLLVRHRASKIVELLSSDESIRIARQKAKENRSKYTGVSSHEVRSSGGFGPRSTATRIVSETNTANSSNSNPLFQNLTDAPVVENNDKHEGNLLDFTEEEEWSEFATAGPVHVSTGVENEPALSAVAPPSATFDKFTDFTEYRSPMIGKQTPSNPIDFRSTNVIMTPEPLATTKIEVPSFPTLISLDAKSLISNEKKSVAGLSLNALRNNQN